MNIRPRPRRSLVIATLCSLLAGCGGASTSSLSPSPSITAAAPAASTVPSIAPAAQIVGDDWTTYAHDQQRSGAQLQNVGVSVSNVANLKLKWHFKATDEVYASPVVYGGLVIICTANSGIVYALDVKTGAVVWQRQLGGQIRMTPAIADGQIFVGTHLFSLDSATGAYYPAPSAFYSLDLLSGTIRWATATVGPVRSEPVIVGGRVFIGVAGGDKPTCLHGGVQALDETSGSVVWSWYVNPLAGSGGAVWGPLAYDGGQIVVGTGNTCNSPVMTSNSLVSLNPADGSLKWDFLATANSLTDDDTGGGALLLDSRLFFISKNGNFYAVDAAGGTQQFVHRLNVDGNGGFATPTSDGATILMSGGIYSGGATSTSDVRQFYRVRRLAAAQTATQTGQLVAYDTAGNTRWVLNTSFPIYNYVAINNGMVFANLANKIGALNIATGKQLWSYTLADLADGGPVVVPSGIYTADNAGDVYAFSPAAATATASSRRY